MGMQDRDYWKAAWNKRDKGDFQGYHNGSRKTDETHEVNIKVTNYLFDVFWPWFRVLFKYSFYVLIVALWLRFIFKKIFNIFI